ncbi:hypothetical protein [Leptolyngbya sp. 7M]|uniref:hypothetical protein n=1 Tax=Leptolyngbya sp. 7M TaxID=2812896 RepID=UPI001B8CD5FD|nr:hypothetical protein [Leptolyngbya sp. 7M]QYO62606.1 hypothetical protein JVX88_21445 [Leptolyngbya sp. 7M]QYU70935.1 hypothetical protein J4558_12845 [Leptolyngbya sp. 15MV]
MIKTADWIVDLGPDGGEVVVKGPPQDVVEVERSYTGHYLASLLKRQVKTAA